jgi:ABC-type microcin C transport system duplicated ATPase subunit YejF
VVDKPTSPLDTSVQTYTVDLLRDFQTRRGLPVSSSATATCESCALAREILVMKDRTMAEATSTERIIATPARRLDGRHLRPPPRCLRKFAAASGSP